MEDEEELEPGVHEAVVTNELLERLETLRRQGWLVEWKPLDDAALADVLGRHIHDRVRDAITGVPISHPDRRKVQIQIANRVLAAVAGIDHADPIDSDGRLLLELKRPLEPPH